MVNKQGKLFMSAGGLVFLEQAYLADDLQCKVREKLY